MNWYNVSYNQGAPSARVDLYDDIGMDPEFPVSGFIQKFNNIAKPIDLHINSNGGEILAGMEIANAIKAHPQDVTAKVDSVAASIASMIAVACDKVLMADNAFMMIHNGHGAASGTPDAMRKQAEVLDKLCGSIAQSYAEKTGKPLPDIQKAMASETWFDADEAKAFGLVDAIEEDGDEEDGEQQQQQKASALRASIKFTTAPLKLRRFAARAEAPIVKERVMQKVYAREGKHFIKIGEAEHEVEMPQTTQTVTTATNQAKPVTADELASAKAEGVKAERAYRNMFASVVRAAGLKDATAEEFEKEFYGRAENDLKFLASHAIGQRAKPIGESAPGNAEGEQADDNTKAEQLLETLATKRFASEVGLRKMYGCQRQDHADTPAYKEGLRQYIASEKRWAADQAAGKHGKFAAQAATK